ncbi:protein GFS12 isoform X2 [Argentina anserina]|uniref:protein GFS12 isoform X2 n=1 Tax=Argentina anserina TaxID=57926 RepID=UPI0021767D34|nr:protein GFS12 isoform X2 [Potentilla anserina]
MAHQMCFDCLHRRIDSDFSGKLVFIHGLSDSAFPFGSNAVVQLLSSSSEAASAPQFLLKYLPSHHQDCLTQFVNEYSLGDDGGVSRDEEEVSSEICTDEKPELGSLKSSKCNHSSRFSCSRVISALAPLAEVGYSSGSIEELASSFLSGSMEEHVLDSLSLLIEWKASGRDSVNFLNLLGVPSFDENPFPGSLRHPNIAPIIGMVKTPGYVDVVHPKAPYTLENILHYSPDALKSDWHIRFLVYQILSALAYIHGLGVAHGNICPSSVMLTESCWSWLCVCDNPGVGINSSSRGNGHMITVPEKVGCCVPGCPSQGLYADLKLSPSIDWHRDFNQWWRGEISNFEYLLILNRLAGRRWGDHTFHTVMPWVIDFSTLPDVNSDTGWRDLSKSKWRLAKGDEQLDFTYSTSEFPHHVSDECLSELAVCSYKARRLPLSVLRMAVRSVYEPNEYPSTMQRLYQWTPDECIPEFFCDPQVFSSIHAGMIDLAVPSWADGPEEFIRLHFEALESDRVSCQLHHWIDITFGYKMSGQAAVAAKNVMLPLSESTMPRSVGRRQLFTEPHPMRRGAIQKPCNSTYESASGQGNMNESRSESSVLSDTAYLQVLEDASAFCEHAIELSALYGYHLESGEDITPVEEQSGENVKKSIPGSSDTKKHQNFPLQINTNFLLEHIKVEDEVSSGYQELLLWRQKSSCLETFTEDVAQDIFSIGCLLAELHLRRPLFNAASLPMYLDSGLLPGPMHELPPHTKLLVEACIQKDCMRRPSAKSLLESPYFPSTVKASYLFLAPLHLRAKDGSCLHYAANFAKQGVLKAMGTFAAEMCAPFCLSLVVTPLSDTEAEWAYTLLKEFIKSLTPNAVKTIVLPAIQKILQTTGYSHLKVSILQDSFVQEIWNRVGKQAFLETVHPLVILNLSAAAHKSSAAAASVLLLGSCEELGIPITIHQTILPLIQCFGKGLSTDGLDVMVRIGGLLGESFIVRQMLPLLKHVVRSCIDISLMNKPEPVHSWSAYALIDSLTTIDGLVAFLPREMVVKELIEDRSCLHIPVLMQTSLEYRVVQVAATTLMAICQRIGPDLTSLHVLPQLKELFDNLAFSPETANASTSPGRKSKILKLKDGAVIESRMDLTLLLYPPFASLLGIEKLRQGCATWLLLERYLLRFHNWKWEHTGELSRSGSDTILNKRAYIKGSTPEYSPAKLLLNGVGWSIPQSQGTRSAKNLMPQKQFDAVHQGPTESHAAALNYKYEPWFWFPSPAASWDGPDFLGRAKDEHPWKIRASVIHSVRAHPGALRYLAVCPDEFTVFTAGIGAGFRGTVQKWELSRINCVSGYYGHEEVVNDICVLSSSGRVASCDGTIHVWNSRTGKLISVFSEPSVDSAHNASPPSSSSRANADQSNMLSSNTMSSGILTGAFDGSLYTSMHQTEFGDTLVAGTGNGSLRFIDVVRGQKLHLWRGDYLELGFPSIVSTICSCGSDKMQPDGVSSPSWIAAGMSSGHCRLFDARSGNVIVSWRAHDGYITKLAAPEDHLLVSSSLDKTLRIWDLRRNVPSQPTILRGHTDGVSSFSVWGQDVISIARNKIGLSSLSASLDDQAVTSQKLYMGDHGARNFSVLSSISILPFSRLFLVGTEDGYLRICC